MKIKKSISYKTINDNERRNFLSGLIFWILTFITTISFKKADSFTNKLKGINKEFAEKVNNKIFASAIHNTSGSISRLVDIAQTYWNNVDKLVYGNTYTAFDQSVQRVNGKYEIDCSSFVNLLMHGVTFENSRYNGNKENIGTSLFHPEIDGYKWRYSNEIGEYAVNNSYAFMPNTDFSNIEAGDILFFSWRDVTSSFHNNAFMKIDHVGVVLHQKNDTIWTLLEFDNDIKTVYYDASLDYMSQCVLVARFPYQNVEEVYTGDNLIISGDVVKHVTNTTIVGSYKLTAPLIKGRYYTLFMSGNVYTPNCYFIVQVNNHTIYSDYGRKNAYTGVITFHFPYLLDDISDTITIGIGAPSGVHKRRSAQVNWISMYEGYAQGKNHYNNSLKSGYIKSFHLNDALVSDLDTNMAPYYKYAVDGNKILINFSLPFKTLRTGSLVLGRVEDGTVTTTQQIPINLIGSTNNAINAVFQVSDTGTVSIIPYDYTVQWKYALVNGFLFKE